MFDQVPADVLDYLCNDRGGLGVYQAIASSSWLGLARFVIEPSWCSSFRLFLLNKPNSTFKSLTQLAKARLVCIYLVRLKSSLSKLVRLGSLRAQLVCIQIELELEF